MNEKYQFDEFANGNLSIEPGAPAEAVAAAAAPERERRDLVARLAKGAACLLVFAFMALAPMRASASFAIGISVGYAPPPLPVYAQPLCPGPGYIWTPGYWAYDPAYGYYWVPGTWVIAPYVGALWTPGYWGWQNGLYVWFNGYWGPTVGFYGGVPYGFGYTGFGYYGGYWDHDQFYYNRSVNNVTNITNVYNRTVINNTRVSNISYNGGPGGIAARPTSAQLAAGRQRHDPPTAAQRQNQQAALRDPAMRASANHGRPPVAATQRPGVMRGSHVVAARSAGGPYRAPASRGAVRTARPAAQGRTFAQRNQTRGSRNARPAGRTQAASRSVRPQRNAAPARNTRSGYRRFSQPQSVPHVPARYRTPPRARRAPQYRAAPRAHRAPPAAPRYRPAPQPRVNRAPRYNPAPRASRAPRPAPQYRAQPRSNGNRSQQGHHPPQ